MILLISEKGFSRKLEIKNTSAEDIFISQKSSQLRDRKPNIVLILTDDQDVELGIKQNFISLIKS